MGPQPPDAVRFRCNRQKVHCVAVRACATFHLGSVGF